jgi:hypothetical protein
MREINLRPLSAQDQIELLDWDPATTPAARMATGILAKCSRLGEGEVARLTLGQREALLLKVRRLTFGDRISCVLRCPQAECGERMDLDLKVSELLLNSHPEADQVYDAVVDDWQVKFRVPDGTDQEALASMAYGDEQRAMEILLGRCVQSVERDGRRWSEIPIQVVDRISEKMAVVDPQAEIALDAICPVCGKAFQTIFDTASFLFTEIKDRARTLLREVHLLASVYHWSEEAILAMPERRRRCYLELAEAALTGRAWA